MNLAEAVPMLDALTKAGADLTVRLHGRTLLHLAAGDGQLQVLTWLLRRGADVHAVNDCPAGCEQRGQTALHDAQAPGGDGASELLLARGARVDALSEAGRSALHVAAAGGNLPGVFLLCRHGADPARKDSSGATPHALAQRAARAGVSQGLPVEWAAPLAQWLEPGGGCAHVAALAHSTGAPVPEDAARVIYGKSVTVGK
jgi:ankyrin repeat protein